LEKESKVQRAMRILDEETSKGPLSVRPMAEVKSDRGKLRRRRSS